MKISFTTMATPELAVAQQFETARAYGFDGVDLRVIERGMGEIARDISREEADRIAAMKKGIEIPALLCYNEKVQAGTEAMTASILEYMQLAKRLNISTIRVFTGRLEKPEDIEILVSVLKTVLEKDTTGVRLAMQNHINAGITLQQGLEICTRIDDPRVKVILSPDHAVVKGEDLEFLVPRLARYTSQLYVADADENHKLVLLGQGVIPYKRILQLLQENGFDGYVTLKWERCWHPELPDYDTAFQGFLAWLKQK